MRHDLIRLVFRAASKIVEETLRDADVDVSASAKARRTQAAAKPFWETPPPPPRIHETVTAVLRRQVPPRKEAPRSWIGGLPMIPNTIAWPRAKSEENPEKGAMPLNFLAQIACADLPAELWGGLGPRQGWLVFFCASWGGTPFVEANTFRVFHIPELGRKRRPPADKLPVGDPHYSGGDNPALIYHLWPVDILCVGNTPEYPMGTPCHDDTPASPIPPDFAATLYPGAEIAKDFWHPKDKPFTWGAVADMLDRVLAKWAAEPTHRIQIERLAADGRDQALAAIDEEEAGLPALSQTADAEMDMRRALYVDRKRNDFAARRAFLAQAGDPFDPETLARMIERSQTDHEVWRARQVDVMIDLLAEANAHDPLAPIAADDRARLDAVFSVTHTGWYVGTDSFSRVRGPQRRTVSLYDMTLNARVPAVAAAARQMYLAGSRERNTLPEHMRLALEADARSLENNRPHRLGGIHQDVQGSVTPAGKVLLLQLGTDEATGFRWGDSGALFAWIGIDALKRCDFGDVQWWTENM